MCHIIADEPTLPVLQNFERKEGKAINVFEWIGTEYTDFGICLLKDDRGNKIARIKADNKKVHQRIKSIFTQWMEGTINLKAMI